MPPPKAKKNLIQPKKAAEPRKEPSPPNWPPLKPLIPAADLSLTTLVQDQIVVIDNFFTSTLCKTLVAFLSTLPLITTPGKPKKGDAVRVNDRFQINDERFAETLWSSTGLKDIVLRTATDEEEQDQDAPSWGGEVLGLNPNIRIYRYTPGQFFAQHCKSRWSL